MEDKGRYSLSSRDWHHLLVYHYPLGRHCYHYLLEYHCRSLLVNEEKLREYVRERKREREKERKRQKERGG